jgi:hypothetical protein
MSFVINPYAFDVNQLIGPNTAINLATHHLKSMMVEGDIPVTDVANNGDAVGTIYEQSVNGLILRNSTANQRPILGSDGTRTSYLTFDGTNDVQFILSSLSFFNTFWQTVPKGCILIWFKMNGGDGATQYILNNMGTVTTNPGIQLFRTNTNKILTRGGDGTLRWTVTSTADVIASTGWVGMIISLNGVGSGVSAAGRFILIDSTLTIFEDKTFDIAAGTVVNANSIMWIGARNDSTLFLNGSISTIIVENFPVSDSLIDQFKNYNPARVTTEFAPIVQYLFDMNNNAFIFNNTAGTVQAADNDPVRVIRSNIVGNLNTINDFGALRRNVSNLVSSGTSPTFQTNVINGKSCIQFDGTDDNLDFLNSLFEELGGKWTFFLVARNDDTTFGSHFLKGNNYVVLTGSGYAGENPPTTVNPYAVVHPNPAGTQIHTNTKGAGVDDFKVMAFRRNGSALAGWNGNKVKTTSTSSSLFSIQDMGEPLASVGPDWYAHGYVAYLKKANGVMTDAQVEAEIDRLNSEYGL